jgi:hypothetical protein
MTEPATNEATPETRADGSPFWVTGGGKACCVDALTDREAIEIAADHGYPAADTARTLPYPAMPRVGPIRSGEGGPCPAFCYKPRGCAGKTSCPTRPSCTS